MTSQSPSLIVLVITLSVCLIAAGFALTLFGAFRKRRGSDPHCRNCGYNLAGAAGPVCSECGADLDAPYVVAVGRPVRRLPLIFVGLLLTLIGLAPLMFSLSDAAKNIDWYKYTPTFLVLRDMRDADQQVATRAFTEMQRRESTGDLSQSQLEQFINACLAEQRAESMRCAVAHAAVSFLRELYLADRLSNEQVEAMCLAGIRDLTFEIRPRLTQGAPCPYRLHCLTRFPYEFKIRREPRAVRVDAVANQEVGACSASSGFCDCTSTGSIRIPVLDVGRHVLELDLEVLIMSDERDETPMFRKMYTLSAPFVIIAGDLEDCIDLVNSPDIGNKVISAFKLYAVEVLKPANAGDETNVQLVFYITEPLPTGVAFDVLIEHQGAEIGRTSVCYARGSQANPCMTSFQMPNSIEGNVDVRCKPSIKAAGYSVTVFEIWNGELLFKNVPLTQSSDGSYSSNPTHLYSAEIVAPN